MATVEPGSKAPTFSLQDQDGKAHRLKDYAGRPVILYFYPKDDTPGCTREACNFRDSLPDFKKSKAAVLGVSILDSASKARFARKHKLNFPLLADPDHAVAEKYGAWKKKSMYGKTFMGLARTTFLIRPDGVVARRWDNVKVDGHADAVLEAVGAL
jgi:thioredoxin-dependent peroxiredoxin